jgi:methyltransferase
MRGFLGLDSRLLFTALVGSIALLRLAELRLARRHYAALIAGGGREVAPGHYRVMVLLHAGFLLACPLEVWLLGRPLRPPLALAMLAALALAMGLRYWAIATLGERWTTRIVCLPGAPAVVRGPYRWIRHPNYLAVVVEMAALPLVHGAWASAAVFSLANALLLRVRIGAEERALASCSDYTAVFAGRPRLVPGIERDSPAARGREGASPSPPATAGQGPGGFGQPERGSGGVAGGDLINASSSPNRLIGAPSHTSGPSTGGAN